MGPIQATLSCLRRPFTFAGRASRSEFWWFVLAGFVIGVAMVSPLYVAMFSTMFDAARLGQEAQPAQIEASVYDAISVPMMSILVVGSVWLWFSTLAVTVRRLHDTDRSGWWYWISVVPLVGYIILLIFLVGGGDHGRNRFGPPPGGAAGAAKAKAKVQAQSQAKRIPKGLPGEPYNPINELTTAEELRALRASRMAS